MRLFARRALVVGSFAALTLAWSGCEASKQTEYVAGVSTQVQVPRDLKTIRIDVSVGGANVFCRAYKVYEGRVQLPRSLGSFPATQSRLGEPITFTVVGFTEDLGDAERSNEFDCLKAIKAGENARILRRSRQPYRRDEIVFLPMALKYSCFDKDCETGSQERTCKAGRCVDAIIDEKTLPRFSEDLVDGTGGGCFRASECFAPAVPAVVVDPNDCTYALPNTLSAPPLFEGAPPNPLKSVGDGINVEVTYDGGLNREILDKDPEEGFTIPDPTKPQRFRLAPGLCDLVKGVGPDGETKHRITAVRATGVCQAKSPFQPLCADDQLAAMGTPGGVAPNANPPACVSTLQKPAKAALMILADDSEDSRVFYFGGGDGQDADSVALSLSLDDPAFAQTEIGLTFFPGSSAACGGFTPAVPLQSATKAKTEISKAFADRVAGAPPLKPLDSEVALSGAIREAALALEAKGAEYERRAILVIGNRGFDASPTCSTSPANAALSARGVGVSTYVVMLTRDQNGGGTADAPPPVPGANELGLAGSGNVHGVFDARTRAAKTSGVAQNALRTIVNELATCVYDVGGAPPAAGDVLTYSDPVAVPPQKTFFSIAPVAGCITGTENVDGYTVTGNRLRVCGKSCSDYRDILRKAALYNNQYTQPAGAVPMFSHKAGCEPK